MLVLERELAGRITHYIIEIGNAFAIDHGDHRARRLRGGRQQAGNESAIGADRFGHRERQLFEKIFAGGGGNAGGNLGYRSLDSFLLEPDANGIDAEREVIGQFLQ